MTHWGRSLWLAFTVAFVNAALFALLTPLWQAPDEPGHVEYACLMAELRRAPQGHERSAALQTQIIHSLAAHNFWRAVRAAPPDPLPARFADEPFLARSASQVGDEPPWYYLTPAALCMLPLPLTVQVRLMRLWGALLFAAAAAFAAWGWGRQPVGSVGWLHPLLLALLPMPAFIAGSINNDTLALAAATLVFALWQRGKRLGWRLRRASGLAAALAVALASKKTAWFLLPWLTLLALTAGWRWLGRRGWSRKRRGAVVLLSIAATALLVQLPTAMPAGWRGFGQLGTGGRVPAVLPDGAAGWAAHVTDASSHAAGRLTQNLDQADAPVKAWRGQTLTLRAWVRSAADAPATGRLLLRDAAHTSETVFTVGAAWQPVAVQHTVALTTTYLTVVAASGADAAGRDEFLLTGATLRAGQASAVELLRNGDFRRPARLGELLAAPWRARWQQFAPRLTFVWPGWAAVRIRLLYLALLFPGFWGNFGWLQRPLPLPVYGLLTLVVVAAGAGLLRLRQSHRSARDLTTAWGLAAGLSILQTVAPMAGRDWQPQGRYLFPALLPLSGLLLLGLDQWLNFAAHPRRAAPLLAAAAVLDLAGLWTATRFL